MTHANPTDALRLDPRPLMASDWSMRLGVHVTLDGDHVEIFPTLLDALAGRPPTKVAIEATFESFDLEARTDQLQKIRTLGHEVYGIRPLNTGRVRNALGLEKSDATDARVIWFMATETDRHFPVLRPRTEEEWEAKMDGLRAEYMAIRREGGKAQLFEDALKMVTPFRDLPDDEKLAAGSAGYTASMLAPVLFLTERTSGRKQFERAAGLHGSAYPTIFRSELMHHSFRHRMKKGCTSSQYRKLIRKLRREILTYLEGDQS